MLDTHFGLIDGDTSGGYISDNEVNKPFSARAVFQKDRRWVLEKIRRNMLSLSFHLNTGVYLIGIDADNRDLKLGKVVAPGTITALGYVAPEKTSIDPNTWRTTATRWIHEATHKYLNTEDHAYADDPTYFTLSLADTLENADSYA